MKKMEMIENLSQMVVVKGCTDFITFTTLAA